MGIFDAFISGTQNAGVFSLYLPFILTFALIYGLLTKSKILGGGRPVNALNAIIAFSIAFYVIAFTSAGVTIATFFSAFFTQVTALITTVVAIVLVLFAMAPIWGDNGRPPFSPGKIAGVVALVIVAIILWSFSSSGGTTIFGIGIPGVGGGGIGFGLSQQDIIIIVFIAITALIIFAVTRPDDAEKEALAKIGRQVAEDAARKQAH